MSANVSDGAGYARSRTTRRFAAIMMLVLFGGVAGATQVFATDEEDPPELEIISDSCEDSGLPPHNGLPDSGRACVETDHGEVGNPEENPSLLIVSAPEQVSVDEEFAIVVSTRNLVRDRFLPAAQGGYYAERSLLNEENLVRGHFHTACRALTTLVAAPDPEPAPAFFIATEDGGGGAEPDQVSVVVDGLAEPGLYQCAVWAGDASHRMPLMSRADQIPAVDIVRITVVD